MEKLEHLTPATDSPQAEWGRPDLFGLPVFSQVGLWIQSAL
jgi:hypothetical protein